MAEGSEPPTPVVADATPQRELLKGEAAVQTSGCRGAETFLLGQGQSADPPAKGVPSGGPPAAGG